MQGFCIARAFRVRLILLRLLGVGLMAARLSEIAQRLADAKSAPRVPLPIDYTRNCWVVPELAISSSLELAVFLKQAIQDVEYLLGMVNR